MSAFKKSFSIKLFSLLLLLFPFSFVSVSAAERVTYRIGTQNDDLVSHVMFDAVSQALNFDVEYVSYSSFSAAYKAVIYGDIDFLPNIRHSPIRATKVDFSQPTNVGYTYLYSKLSQAITLETAKVIAIPAKTVFGRYIQDFNPSIKVIEYSSVEQAKQWVKEGKADGIVAAIHYLETMVADGQLGAELLNYQLPLKPVSIATTKGKHAEILKRIEAYVQSYSMQQLLRESTIQYQRDVQAQALRNRLAKNRFSFQQPVKIALVNSVPHAFYRPDGRVDGLVVATLSQACDILAIQCQFVSKETDTFSESKQAFEQKQVDIFGPVSVTPERQKKYNLTQSHYDMNIILVKRVGYKVNVYHNINQLFSERIGVIENSVYQTLAQQRLPHKSLIKADNYDQLITSLINHETDYILLSQDEYNHYLAENNEILPITDVKSIGTVASYPLALALQPTGKGKKLTALLDDAIKLIDTNELLIKYQESFDWKETLDHERRFRELVQMFFFIIMATLVAIFYIWQAQSKLDHLTKLRNRFALYRKYHRGLKKGQVLIYFDVNKFKVINDSYGHDVGDEVLKKIAKRIRRHWGFDSYRIGGDEFVLVGRYNEDVVHQLMAEIGYFDYPVESTPKFRVSISYGVYLSNGQNLNLDEILQSSDSEMYQFKSVYHAAMQ